MPPSSPRSGRGTRRLIRRGEPTGLVPRGPGAEDGFRPYRDFDPIYYVCIKSTATGEGGEPRQDPSGFLTPTLGLNCLKWGFEIGKYILTLIQSQYINRKSNHAKN